MPEWRPVEVRLWEKCDERDMGYTTPCWLWTARTGQDGYGRINIDGSIRQAHRVAYVLEVGPIPRGLTIDHLCRVRRCCNPAHLEPVSEAVNILRGVGRAAINARRTECSSGHSLDEANTYVYPRTGRRACRICVARWQRESQARKKAIRPPA